MKKLFLAIIIIGAAVGGYFVVNIDFTALFQQSQAPAPITEQEARAVISKQISGDIQEITYINSDTPYYKATVQTDNETLTIEVDAISKRISIQQQVTASNSPSETKEDQTQTPALPLTKESATQLALQHFEGDVTSVILLQQNDQTSYEIELESKTETATLSFDQQTGELIKNEITDRQTNGSTIDSVASVLPSKSNNNAQPVTKPSINNTTTPSNTTITLDDAKQIASQKIDGDIKSAKLINQNEYVIKIQTAQDIYTLKIHAKTGAIISTKKN